MSDTFALLNHNDEVIKLLDISNLPNTVDKLISLSLDPFVYRVRWESPNKAIIWEFWYNTDCYKFVRIPLDKIGEFNHRLFIYKSNYVPTALRLPYVASSSPFHLNSN